MGERGGGGGGGEGGEGGEGGRSLFIGSGCGGIYFYQNFRPVQGMAVK